MNLCANFLEIIFSFGYSSIFFSYCSTLKTIYNESIQTFNSWVDGKFSDFVTFR